MTLLKWVDPWHYRYAVQVRTSRHVCSQAPQRSYLALAHEGTIFKPRHLLQYSHDAPQCHSVAHAPCTQCHECALALVSHTAVPLLCDAVAHAPCCKFASPTPPAPGHSELHGAPNGPTAAAVASASPTQSAHFARLHLPHRPPLAMPSQPILDLHNGHVGQGLRGIGGGARRNAAFAAADRRWRTAFATANLRSCLRMLHSCGHACAKVRLPPPMRSSHPHRRCFCCRRCRAAVSRR